MYQERDCFSENQIRQISFRGMAALAARCAMRVQPLFDNDIEDDELRKVMYEAVRITTEFAGGADPSPPSPHARDTDFFGRVMRLASNDGTYDAAVAAVHAECLVEIAHNNVDGGESAAQVSASGAELGAYDLNLTIRSAVSAARARLGEESASHFMSMVFRDYAVLLAVSSRQPSNWRGSGIKMSDSGDLGPLWISGLPGGITPEPPSPALVRSPGLPNAIPQCVSIFYSYSHRDESARNELEKHLSVLRRQDVIKNWHDRKIGAGEEWKGKIDKHLESADVVLLLVSADFLDSDYCYDIEMRRAMERHESREAIVIPIIIRSCDWHQTAFGKLQALPKDGMAVKSWRNRDEAFRDIAVGIRKVVSQLLINPG